MVERQVKHLARLVDDLLDVSRITHGSIRLRKEAVDLGTIVERAVEATRPLIDSRGHKLTLKLPPDPVRLEADPTRLEQVIANLLNNAAKYTMPGGHIWVTAGLEGAEAVMRVRDNGIGVPPDVLDRVFEPFVQSEGSLARSEGGLGIGLTLVRSLVEMHGGSVEAHSPGLGQGSEFVSACPPACRPRSWRPCPSRLALQPTRGLRVLVVEDNVDAAESLAALLRLWGHDVRVVHDGLAALEAARGQRPEVVLLDIGLPGLDGYQVARRLREDVEPRRRAPRRHDRLRPARGPAALPRGRHPPPLRQAGRAVRAAHAALQPERARGVRSGKALLERNASTATLPVNVCAKMEPPIGVEFLFLLSRQEAEMAQRKLGRALTAAVLAAVFATAPMTSAASAEGPVSPAQSVVEQAWQWMGSALEKIFPSPRARPLFPDKAPDDLPEQCPVCGDKGGGIDPNG